jgi:ribosomal protein L37AE/L43A
MKSAPDKVVISIIDVDAEMWHCRHCGYEGFGLAAANAHAGGHLPVQP